MRSLSDPWKRTACLFPQSHKLFFRALLLALWDRQISEGTLSQSWHGASACQSDPVSCSQRYRRFQLSIAPAPCFAHTSGPPSMILLPFRDDSVSLEHLLSPIEHTLKIISSSFPVGTEGIKLAADHMSLCVECFDVLDFWCLHFCLNLEGFSIICEFLPANKLGLARDGNPAAGP